MPILECGKLQIDYSDAGAGDPVVLVHSSVSGNRQWKKLTLLLQQQFSVIAVNLFGYGETSPWNMDATQTIADQADLVLRLVDRFGGPIRIVGHSFGGSVACKAAAVLGKRVSHLVVFEPTLFNLLAQNGHREAYAEVAALRDFIRLHGGKERWQVAAERFAEYWMGHGEWGRMPQERRIAYTHLLRPNYHEWDSVDGDQTTIEQFGAIPAGAMMLYSPDARRPSREIARLFEARCRRWSVRRIAGGGHMAPLTHPDLVNPLIAGFLGDASRGGGAISSRRQSVPSLSAG